MTGSDDQLHLFYLLQLRWQEETYVQMDAALKFKGLSRSFRGVDIVLASDSLQAVEL